MRSTPMTSYLLLLALTSIILAQNQGQDFWNQQRSAWDNFGSTSKNLFDGQKAQFQEALDVFKQPLGGNNPSFRPQSLAQYQSPRPIQYPAGVQQFAQGLQRTFPAQAATQPYPNNQQAFPAQAVTQPYPRQQQTQLNTQQQTQFNTQQINSGRDQLAQAQAFSRRADSALVQAQNAARQQAQGAARQAQQAQQQAQQQIQIQRQAQQAAAQFTNSLNRQNPNPNPRGFNQQNFQNPGRQNPSLQNRAAGFPTQGQGFQNQAQAQQFPSPAPSSFPNPAGGFQNPAARFSAAGSFQNPAAGFAAGGNPHLSSQASIPQAPVQPQQPISNSIRLTTVQDQAAAGTTESDRALIAVQKAAQAAFASGGPEGQAALARFTREYGEQFGNAATNVANVISSRPRTTIQAAFNNQRLNAISGPLPARIARVAQLPAQTWPAPSLPTQVHNPALQTQPEQSQIQRALPSLENDEIEITRSETTEFNQQTNIQYRSECPPKQKEKYTPESWRPCGEREICGYTDRCGNRVRYCHCGMQVSGMTCGPDHPFGGGSERCYRSSQDILAEQEATRGTAAVHVTEPIDATLNLAEDPIPFIQSEEDELPATFGHDSFELPDFRSEELQDFTEEDAIKASDPLPDFPQEQDRWIREGWDGAPQWEAKSHGRHAQQHPVRASGYKSQLRKFSRISRGSQRIS